MIYSTIFLLFYGVCLADAQRLVKGGQNVCTKQTTTSKRERYCAYNTWQACCYWLTRTTSIYKEEVYCCSGYSQQGSSCPNPICSTNCGGPSRGTCIAPERCRCEQGYTGYTCEGETCSHRKPCYPGTCTIRYGVATCECQDGFNKTSDTEGCTKLLRKPLITKAFATMSFYNARKNMDIYKLSVDASDQSSSINNEIWTNMKDFNTITADLSSLLELPSLPGTPSYISKSDTRVGISSAYVNVLHKKRGIGKRSVRKRNAQGNLYNQTLECISTTSNQAPNNRNPETSLLTCRQMKKSSFDLRLDSGDEITIIFNVAGGGQEVIMNDNNRYRSYSFSGPYANSAVNFKIDHDSPIAPSTDTDIFHVDKDITKGPSIYTSWRGWTDILSGMSRYNWEIFRLEKSGLKLREEKAKYLSPIHSYVANSTGNRFHTYNYTYTPKEAGVYSLILEAADKANNSKYIRRFVIYDPTSEITTTSTPLKVLSGNANASYKWQTWRAGLSTNIDFSWKGHFINQAHVDGGFLLAIEDYPPQLNDMNVPPGTEFKKTIDKSLVDSSSIRTQADIPNVDGITSFEVGKTSKVRGTAPDIYIEKGLSQSHIFNIPNGSIADGTFVKLFARATDVLGNTKTSTMLLGFDRTSPDLSSVKIEPNTGNTYTYTSTISFKTSDRHSGIDRIDYKLVEESSNTETKSGTIPVRTSQYEPSEFDGYSVSDSYFLYLHNFPINNCWLKVGREDAGSKSYRFQLTVKNGAGLTAVQTTQVGELKRFQGIGTYQGIRNVTVENTRSGVTLKWQFIDSCYKRKNLQLKYWDPDGNENERKVHKDANRFDISNLQSSTTYNVSLLIEYDLGTSEEKRLQFITANNLQPLSATKESPTGNIVGAAAGGIILMLVLAIVIMCVMIKMGRLQRVNVAVIEPIRRTIRRKSDSAYNQYNMGGFDKEDIYMYGGITYERTPDWQYNADKLSLGGIISVGRFARIYNATLHTGRKSKHVAAKTLKDEFSEEDSILMKAKINFYTTKVGNHPCVIGFEGAVIDYQAYGPVMLLELCREGPLKGWLVDNREKADEEIMERLFRFTYDTVRGMEFLADKEIVHMRLAARNILLTDSLEAKISGFGPRHGESEEEDGASKRERIPVKWIAPECLANAKNASEKSDVWSYGITIWEIFSMGQTPYGNVKSKDLQKWLKKGNKLPKPEYCDDTHFEIMKECWDFDPVMRPSFSTIHRKIESLFRQSSGDLYYYGK